MSAAFAPRCMCDAGGLAKAQSAGMDPNNGGLRFANPAPGRRAVTSSSDIILHHFDASPFSEKIRVIFGFKKIAWRSCLISRIMPRPDLMPLTGGYRRTPVMQIGADIFCDTQIIIRELGRRVSKPWLFPPGEPAGARST